MSLTSNTMTFTVGRLLYMTEISENALLNHSQHVSVKNGVCHGRCLSRTVSLTDGVCHGRCLSRTVSVTDGVCHGRCLSRAVSVTDVSVTDGLVYQL